MSKIDYAQFGREVKSYRESQGLSLSDLSRLLFVQYDIEAVKGHLSEIENGNATNLSANTFVALLAWMQRPADAFTGQDKEPKWTIRPVGKFWFHGKLVQKGQYNINIEGERMDTRLWMKETEVLDLINALKAMLETSEESRPTQQVLFEKP